MTAASDIPAATLCSYPARAGNLVRPMADGLDAFRRIAEAVEAARHSVWLTVAFHADDFRFPDGRGALFDVLDSAVARGLDVRLLAWRPNPETEHYGRVLGGAPAGSRVRIRWDRAATVFCQHQKSWMIDAGQPSETAFVGGINLSTEALRRHDAYVEVAGPSATDVHHNFVQRWNEASERTAADGNWACDATDALPFPQVASGSRGTSVVQIQRTLHADRYTDGRATPGHAAFDVARGERSILEQYKRAIDAARRTIYLENQAIPIPEIAHCLERALERGVEVVLLVPAIPEPHVYEARRNPAQRARFDGLEALGRHPNFLLAGVAASEEGERRPTYVHAKLMVIDDAWATIGSCNLHALSLSGHSEMNASVWDGSVVRPFRCTLLAKHLAVDTAALDDLAALRLYRRLAHANRRKWQSGDPDWQGSAFALSPAAYATTPGKAV
ncbi:MAG: phosphatidylserine/phosphatidylglycerophosphate/cardiolipin synthase family protein [Reyranella sp.]|nr:phosphatidylserine/phosphatidylglycerophosphate/cardiolipin synthase family protein [Reyranella sp.]